MFDCGFSNLWKHSPCQSLRLNSPRVSGPCLPVSDVYNSDRLVSKYVNRFELLIKIQLSIHKLSKCINTAMHINRKTEYKLSYASTIITHYITKKVGIFLDFRSDPESDRIHYFTKCQRRGGLQRGFLNSKPNWSIFKDFFSDF